MTGHISVFLSLLSGTLLSACASGALSTLPKTPPALTSPMEIATSLRDNGRYLEASYYLESAIPTAEAELPWLALLIECQIRSGRLLSARFSLHRFLFLTPEPAEAQILFDVLSRTTGTHGFNEVHP